MKRFAILISSLLLAGSVAQAALTVTNTTPVCTNAYTAVLNADLTAKNAGTTTTMFLFDLTDKGTATLSAWKGRVTVSANAGTGTYSATVSNLLDGITYFVRAAAKDSTSTSIAANVKSFVCTTGGNPGTVNISSPVEANSSDVLAVHTSFFTANATAIKSAIGLSGATSALVLTNAAGEEVTLAITNGLIKAITVTPAE
jgi:hypothetical protein